MREKTSKSRGSYLLRKKRNELEKLLAIIQKISDRDYIFEDKIISPRDLVRVLFRSFEVSAKYDFALGNYRISLTMEIVNLGQTNVETIITRDERLLQRSSGANLHSWEEGLTAHDSSLLNAFREVIKALSEDILCPTERLSLLGHIVRDRSDKDGKMMPKWIGLYDDLRQLADAGDVKGLKKLLKKRYADQRPLVIPEAMSFFYADGREEIARAKKQQKVLDPSIDILEKIEKGIVGGSHFFIVPTLEGKLVVERKVFLYVYNVTDTYAPDVFLQVLTEAGWGGAVLVATANMSALHEFLDTKQIDFIVQNSLGMQGKGDIYMDELINRADADYWNGKIARCELVDGEESEIYFQASRMSPAVLPNELIER